MADESDVLTEEISAQLDGLLGPVPEPVETQDSGTTVEDGAAERWAREFTIRFGT